MMLACFHIEFVRADRADAVLCGLARGRPYVINGGFRYTNCVDKKWLPCGLDMSIAFEMRSHESALTSVNDAFTQARDVQQVCW